MERRKRRQDTAGKAVGAVCASGRAHVLLFTPRTAVAGGRGCLGSPQPRLCWVRAPHSFILAAGAAAMLCGELLGWLAGLEEHQNDFILEICPCGALSVPWLSQPRAGRAAGTCSTHDCPHPFSNRSAGKRAGGEGSQARAARTPFGTPDPKPGSFLPLLSLSLVFLSSPCTFSVLIARQRG